ncbi:iron-sulfur cluster assembly accessory protein [Buchnera aphidicola (Mollitrichosiphum nigrofasciatum)]|uniref:iron-sulfur cluster assembly accessory protein n=1 Tax=Buchnera aphidicola TaxID=9 RepID=UPI0031B83CFF
MCILKKNKIKLTKNAFKQINKLLIKNKNIIGIIINIKKTGCAGYKYDLKFKKIKEIKKKEYLIKSKNIKFFIKKKQKKYIEGLKIDFIKKGLNKTFIFTHESKKNTCGCGESFQI